MATSAIEGSQAGTNFAAAMTEFAKLDMKLGTKRMMQEIAPLLNAKGIKLNLWNSDGSFVGIRNMVGELEKLRALNDKNQLLVLSELFGQEAARPLSVFINQGVAGYDAMLLKMQQQADMQKKIDAIMSGTKMKWESLTGTVGNLVAAFGGVVTKVSGVASLLDIVNTLAGGLSEWVLAHPRTAGLIGGAAVAITGMALAIGGLLLTIGLGGTVISKMVMGYGMLVQGLGLLKMALAGLIPMVWSFTVALLSNPVTWIVLAVVAGAALIGGALVWMYRRVEWFKTLMDGFLFFIGFSIGLIAKGWVNLAQWIMAPFSLILSAFGRVIVALPQITGAISDALAGMLNSLPELLSKLFASGQKIVTTLVAGIRSVGPQLVGAVREIFGKVRNLLPFSDAKEGPLSQLTLSGSRIMYTLGEGIMGAAPKLHKTMATALAGAALTTSIAVAPVPSFAATPEAKTAAKDERSARTQRNQVVIKIGNITLPGVSNASDFVAQLQALVEAYDA